ncbi:MAG: hypothetical protein ABIN89_24705 [Chitinophagaceae bacterium]
MKSSYQPLETLQDIKSMMERSSRFISLSGWSGISAGICALLGAWLAMEKIAQFKIEHRSGYTDNRGAHFVSDGVDILSRQLITIAAGVFIAAFISAFLFTYLRSKKAGIQIWGSSARRLMWNTLVPMVVGGVVVLRMLDLKYYLLIAPCCLIFYGLALVNGSKYTLGEVRFMGYCQIILGLLNLWIPGYGIIFWALGFGLLHIIYGGLMWWKYERV